MDWLGVKHAIITGTDVSPDALHLLAGILIYIPLALLLDGRLRSIRGLLLTAALVCAGEAADWLNYRLGDEWLAMARIWPDIVGGLTWPLIFFLAGPWLRLPLPKSPHADV